MKDRYNLLYKNLVTMQKNVPLDMCAQHSHLRHPISVFAVHMKKQRLYSYL